MADWEEEFEEQVEEVKQVKTVSEMETEEIIKPKTDYKPPSKEKKENPNDYEKKWSEKNQDIIKRNENNKKSVEGLDEKDAQKKLIDKRIMDDVSDFMGLDKNAKKEVTEVKVAPLMSEKDFIELAVHNVGRIKAAGKPSKFTQSYLKNTLDLLAPTLDSDKLDVLIKDLTLTFNKKLKESKGKTKGTATSNKAKPSVNVGKGMERADKMGAIQDYGGDDDYNYDDDYEDDDFM